MAISVTAAAAGHVQRQLDARGHGEGIRIGVKTSGCSGFGPTCSSSLMLFSPKIRFFEDFGVKLYVDPKSLVYLDGTIVDFAKEGLNEGLEFRNPNVAGECGCGESFTV